MIGVLALQGASQEHIAAFASLGVRAIPVRMPEDLEGVDGLVLPGGESTTMSMLLESSGLFDPIAKRLADAMPVFGTCAGMILLSTRVQDGRGDQRSFGVIDLSVRRNGFGRQVSSFETDLSVESFDGSFRAVFIRAPLVEEVGEGVEVLARVDVGDHIAVPVLCCSGRVLVSSFHPELTADTRLHRLFLDLF